MLTRIKFSSASRLIDNWIYLKNHLMGRLKEHNLLFKNKSTLKRKAWKCDKMQVIVSRQFFS